MPTTYRERQVAGLEDLSPVHDRYGGADIVASVVGMFAGLGTLIFVSALIAAGAGGIDYQLNVISRDGTLGEESLAGLLTAGLVVFAAFIVGGFAAGRMARYNGGMNGLGAGLWMILLVAAFAGAGAWVATDLNAFNQDYLPNWFAQVNVDELTAFAAIASGVLVIATLVGGYLGGRLGETYHHKVDAALVQATN